MELLENLTKSLGITEDQAKGGTGLLLKLAKEKIGGDDFSKVAGAIPGLQDLLNNAPQEESGGGLMGGLGGLASSLGGGSGGLGQLGNLASLAGGFSKLGLSSGMIGQFIPVILSFVENKGGSPLKAILEKAIK